MGPLGAEEELRRPSADEEGGSEQPPYFSRYMNLYVQFVFVCVSLRLCTHGGGRLRPVHPRVRTCCVATRLLLPVGQ